MTNLKAIFLIPLASGASLVGLLFFLSEDIFKYYPIAEDRNISINKTKYITLRGDIKINTENIIFYKNVLENGNNYNLFIKERIKNIHNYINSEKYLYIHINTGNPKPDLLLDHDLNVEKLTKSGEIKFGLNILNGKNNLKTPIERFLGRYKEYKLYIICNKYYNICDMHINYNEKIRLKLRYDREYNVHWKNIINGAYNILDKSIYIDDAQANHRPL